VLLGCVKSLTINRIAAKKKTRRMLRLVSDFFLAPFRNLYISGPAALGFWQGADPESICAQLTGTSESVWHHPDAAPECFSLIDRRFEAYRSLLIAGLYMVVVYRVASDTWTRYFVVRPFLRDLRIAVGCEGIVSEIKKKQTKDA